MCQQWAEIRGALGSAYLSMLHTTGHHPSERVKDQRSAKRPAPHGLPRLARRPHLRCAWRRRDGEQIARPEHAGMRVTQRRDARAATPPTRQRECHRSDEYASPPQGRPRWLGCALDHVVLCLCCGRIKSLRSRKAGGAWPPAAKRHSVGQHSLSWPAPRSRLGVGLHETERDFIRP